MGGRSARKSKEKVRENRLRRVAVRRGLVLRRSRRRDPDAVDYGAYWLIDGEGDYLVYGDQWGTDLDGIEEFLTGGGHGKA
jgi:hypothetical protein